MLELDTLTVILTLLSGGIVGFFLGTFGGGGSVLAAPLLLYAVGIGDTHLALGTSAAGVAAIALVNLVGHWRAGRVKWPCALLFAGAGLAGAVAGSSVAKATGDDALLLAFAIAMAAVGLSMFRKPQASAPASVSLTKRSASRIVPTGLAVGTASGFFGIGGGFLIVPGLMASAGMTLGHAAAASLVSVAAFGAATSLNYAVSGMVNVPITLVMLIGGGLGGVIGLRAAKLLTGRERLGRSLFASMILIVAAYVGFDAATRLLT